MDNNNTILLAKIRDVLSTLCGMFTSDLAIIKAKLEGISDLIIRNDITTDTDTIEFNTDMTEKLCKCDISFSYIQAGTGTPAPDNVRAISGYDSISVAVLDSHDPDSYLIKEIEFDNTVYGGNIDIISGIGKSTHAFIDLNDFSYNEPVFENNLWRITATGQIYDTNNIYKLGVCNKLVFKTNYNDVNQNNYSIAFNNVAGLQIILRNDDLTAETVIDFVKSLTVAYPLATPAAISTTPEDITPIEGDNKISTNSTYSMANINTTGIEVCYFETVNNYFKNKEV